MVKNIGEDVSWNWGNATPSGTIKQIYTKRVSKTLQGTEVVRNGSEENPAYLIEQESGDQVLKLDSELE